MGQAVRAVALLPRALGALLSWLACRERQSPRLSPNAPSKEERGQNTPWAHLAGERVSAHVLGAFLSPPPRGTRAASAQTLLRAPQNTQPPHAAVSPQATPLPFLFCQGSTPVFSAGSGTVPAATECAQSCPGSHRPSPAGAPLCHSGLIARYQSGSTPLGTAWPPACRCAKGLVLPAQGMCRPEAGVTGQGPQLLLQPGVVTLREKRGRSPGGFIKSTDPRAADGLQQRLGTQSPHPQNGNSNSSCGSTSRSNKLGVM